MKTIFKLIVLFIFIVGCKDNEKISYGYSEIAFDEDYSVQGNLLKEEKASSETPSKERKLIKNGSIEFEVVYLKKTRAKILKAVKKYNGYVSTDNEYNSSDRKSTVINIRVPATNFDALLKDISEGIESFDQKNIRIKDVTEQFLDVEARLKNKKELEKRYLEILKKAKSVKEILEVEKEIGKLREDIEVAEGKLKYLQNQVSFSTLNITFYKTISNPTNFGKNISEAFKNGFKNLKTFLIFIINIWPFILLISLVFYLLKRWRNKRKK